MDITTTTHRPEAARAARGSVLTALAGATLARADGSRPDLRIVAGHGPGLCRGEPPHQCLDHCAAEGLARPGEHRHGVGHGQRQVVGHELPRLEGGLDLVRRDARQRPTGQRAVRGQRALRRDRRAHARGGPNPDDTAHAVANERAHPTPTAQPTSAPTAPPTAAPTRRRRPPRPESPPRRRAPASTSEPARPRVPRSRRRWACELGHRIRHRRRRFVGHYLPDLEIGLDLVPHHPRQRDGRDSRSTACPRSTPPPGS